MVVVVVVVVFAHDWYLTVFAFPVSFGYAMNYIFTVFFCVLADMFPFVHCMAVVLHVAHRYDFDAYSEASDTMYGIFLRYAPVVMAVSCDEAFLELPEGTNPMTAATQVTVEFFLHCLNFSKQSIDGDQNNGMLVPFAVFFLV